MTIKTIKKEIEYYSKVYNPKCKKVQKLKKKLIITKAQKHAINLISES